VIIVPIKVILICLVLPFIEMLLPQTHGEVLDIGDQGVVLMDMLVCPEEGVHEALEVVIHIGPNRDSLALKLVELSVMLTVVEESAELA
jgi:hypothetical protein